MDPISGVTIIQGDIQEPAVLAELLSMMPKPTVDVIVSDMAPNLMGNASVDAARSLALWNMAVDVAEDLLEPQGSLCIKVFHGPGFDAFVKKLRGLYTKVQVYKPKASKAESSEVYLVAQRKVGSVNSDSEV
jgi:23S rRNA (uridine2552-2'-O)-methyltransferase